MSIPFYKSKEGITVLILVFMAITTYAPLIDWGLPYATAPDRTKTFATDEILPLETVAEMHNTFVVSKPDRNYGYPWWHYFVVTIAQAPYIVYLLFSGGLQSPSPIFPFGLKTPIESLQILTLIGRSVSVLMGAGVVVSAYYFSRTLWGHLTGVVAALLTMLNYLMIYYSRTGNLDVPVFFWSSISLIVFAKILVEGFTVKRAAMFGVFAGLAMATKDQAVVLFFPLACILVLPRFNHPRGSNYRLKSLLVGLGTAIVVYVIATGMVVDPRRHITHVYCLFFNQGRLTSALAYWPPHPRTWAGTVNLILDFIRGLVVTISLPVLVVSVIGAALVLRRSPRLLVLLLPVPALLLLLNLPTGLVVLRYFLPLVLVIDAFAAYAILALRETSIRRLWVPLIVVLFGWRMLIGADLTYAQYHDSRYAASVWLTEHARPSDQVEYFGSDDKLPHLPAEIKTQLIAGRTKWTGEFKHGSSVLKYLEKQGPEYILIIPDWTSHPGMERSQDCPPEVYASLVNGSIGYTQAAFFPTRSLLFGPLQRPPLDNPSVCPPVRIFARNDTLSLQSTER